MSSCDLGCVVATSTRVRRRVACEYLGILLVRTRILPNVTSVMRSMKNEPERV